MSSVSAKIIQLNWDKVEGATKYELKLFKVKGSVKKEIKLYQSVDTNWSEELKAGFYAYQIRTLDYRNVPGEWSELGNFTVKYNDIKIISPIKNQTFYQEDNGRIIIRFKWKKQKGASSYRLYLVNKKLQIINSELTSSNAFEKNFSKPGRYYWKVVRVQDSSDKANKREILENIKINSFKVLPSRIPAPAVELKQSLKKLIVTWQGSPLSKRFKLELYRKAKKDQWKKVYVKKIKRKRHIINGRRIKTGYYRLKVYSYGRGQISAPGVLYFQWKNKTLSKISSDRPMQKRHLQYLKEKGGKTPFIFEGSFSLMNKTYIGNVNLTQTQVESPLSGNRFTLKSFFIKSKKNNYELDFSYENIVSDTSSWSFLDIESYYNYFKTTKKYNFLVGAGLFYKEYPYIDADGVEVTFDKLKSSSLGTIFQIKYGYNIGNKAQFGLHFKARLALLGVKTPPNLNQSISFTNSMEAYFKFSIKSDLAVGAAIVTAQDSVQYEIEEVTTNGKEIRFFAIVDL